MLFCEDSIVRGTQLRDIIRRLFDARRARGAHAPRLPAAGLRLPVPELLALELGAGPGRAPRHQRARGRRRRNASTNTPIASTDRYAAMVERIRQRLGLTTLRTSARRTWSAPSGCRANGSAPSAGTARRRATPDRRPEGNGEAEKIEVSRDLGIGRGPRGRRSAVLLPRFRVRPVRSFVHEQIPAREVRLAGEVHAQLAQARLVARAWGCGSCAPRSRAAP